MVLKSVNPKSRYDNANLERAVMFIKTAKDGKTLDFAKGVNIKVEKGKVLVGVKK